MRFLHPNVPLLSTAQALMMSCNSMIIASAALVGNNLAVDKSLATLPAAVMYVSVMCTSIPAAMVMEKIGRKAAFMIACFFGALGGALAGTAILTGNFWLFVGGTVLVGMFNGFGNYFRFTAADSVEIAYKSKAVSYIMLGGVVAAVAGPTLARVSREWIPEAEFAGGYLAIILAYVLIFVIVTFLKIDRKTPGHDEAGNTGRPLMEIASQPAYIVAVICAMLGYGVMSLVMTATPLAMDHAAFQFDDTAVVIQWHVMAMFAPSFFTGSLILRFGALRILFMGAVFGLLCIMTNLLGTGYLNFLVALSLLGLSWNFLFVGGTTLLTETYHANERNKAQALNDFIVFSTVALSSLSSGALHNALGWEAVNKAALPCLLIVFLSIAWLKYSQSREINKAV